MGRIAYLITGFILGLAAGMRIPRATPKYREETEELFCINRWSLSRSLTRERLETIEVEAAPHQDWFEDPAPLRRAVAERPRPGGPALSLVDFKIDHREGGDGQVFSVSLAPSLYRDFLGLGEALTPEIKERLRSRIARGEIAGVVRGAPLSVVAMNVAVVSEDNKVLCLRRSGAVESSPGMWTLGPHETMQPGEDFFTLAQRGLSEELGLQVDYRSINISWIGYDLSAPLVHLCAQVRVPLSAQEIEESIGGAHGNFEADRIEWIEFTRQALQGVETASGPDNQGREWIPAARLGAAELWRSKELI